MTSLGEHGRRAARVTAHDRALDRARQPGVRPVAGEIETRAAASRSPGRGGPPGASENVARVLANDDRSARAVRAAHRGNAARSCSSGEAR